MGQGVFLYHRCIDIFFLNRMNSRQGIVKKEQEIIFAISKGSTQYFQNSFKDTISAYACSF